MAGEAALGLGLAGGLVPLETALSSGHGVVPQAPTTPMPDRPASCSAPLEAVLPPCPAHKLRALSAAIIT